jgi:hypothetical protein
MKHIIKLFCSIFFLFSIFSCSFDESTNSDNYVPDEKTQAVIDEYSIIGTSHNEKLTGYYQDTTDKSSETFNKYFEISSNYSPLTLSIIGASGKGFQPNSIVDELDKEEMLDSDELIYLKKIENILYSSYASSNDVISTQNYITKIEGEAVINVSEDSLAVIMSYAETAKSSLTYWSSDTSLLMSSSLMKNTSARAATGAELVFLVAAADAAGAAAGYIAGELFVIGACAVATPAVAAGLQAAQIPLFCSIYCGAVSSAQTYENGTFTISIDISSLIKNWTSA